MLEALLSIELAGAWVAVNGMTCKLFCTPTGAANVEFVLIGLRQRVALVTTIRQLGGIGSRVRNKVPISKNGAGPRKSRKVSNTENVSR